MAKTLMAVIAEPGKQAEVREIEGGLESLRSLVGGTIDVVRMGGPLAAYINDEGLLMGLPWNRRMPGGQLVAGTIVAVSTDTEGEDVSPTESQFRYLLSWLNSPGSFIHGWCVRQKESGSYYAGRDDAGVALWTHDPEQARYEATKPSKWYPDDCETVLLPSSIDGLELRTGRPASQMHTTEVHDGVTYLVTTNLRTGETTSRPAVPEDFQNGPFILLNPNPKGA